jgi:RNA polymerase sigma-70 factor (ECF subfamily)
MAAADDAFDDDLMARVARGDREAFAALYRRRRPDVLRFALHMSGSHAIADDVVQDVFVGVIEGAGRYEPGRASVRAWLLGIARNLVRRALVRSRPTEPLPDDDASGALTVDADPLPALVDRQRIAALRHGLRELPVRFREAVVLCDLEELTYVEAAASLGCAVGTVRSRLHRGRAQLARRLRADGEAPLRSRLPRWVL